MATEGAPLHKKYTCPVDNATLPEMLAAVEKMSTQLTKSEMETVLRMIVSSLPARTDAYTRHVSGTLVDLRKLTPNTIIQIYEHLLCIAQVPGTS